MISGVARGPGARDMFTVIGAVYLRLPFRRAARRIESDHDFLVAALIQREEGPALRRHGGEPLAERAPPDLSGPGGRPGRCKAGFIGGEVAVRAAELSPFGCARLGRYVRGRQEVRLESAANGSASAAVRGSRSRLGKLLEASEACFECGTPGTADA